MRDTFRRVISGSLPRPSELEVLRAARRVQHQEGLTEAVEVGPEEIARLNPAVALDEVIGGAFCPSDGFIRPLGIVEGYLTAARRLGVELEWQVEVTGLRLRARAIALPGWRPRAVRFPRRRW